MKSTQDFLSEDVYLPGWMTLQDIYHQRRGLDFTFSPREPEVTRLKLDYVTPRGLHITLSQAGLCLFERVAEEEGLIQGTDLRSLAIEGRLKVVQLDQKFRREIPLEGPLRGRMNVEKLRMGRVPFIGLTFDFEENAIKGYIGAVIAPEPVPQTNYDILRN
jgi:hypothetical protein